MAIYDITTQEINPLNLRTGDIMNCPCDQAKHSITLPKGIYKLECWGAQGGSVTGTDFDGIGGYGGYAKGEITFADSTTIILTAGGQPAQSTPSYDNETPGGYNGGGKGFIRIYSGTSSYGQGGGGASDIRIGTDSLYARVIVAGGGGGTASDDASTVKYGGGEESGSGYAENYGYNATQRGSSEGRPDKTNVGSFGIGANVYLAGVSSGYYKYGAGGAGGGWYGGSAFVFHSDDKSEHRTLNGGGSSYVYTAATAVNYPEDCLLNSAYYLSNTSNIAGNQTIIAPDGTSQIGSRGNGYIRITIISVNNTQTHYVNTNLNNCVYNGTLYFQEGDAISGTLTPSNGYGFDSRGGGFVKIEDGRGDITSSAFNPSDNTISFLGNSETYINAIATTYQVTHTETHCHVQVTAFVSCPTNVAPYSSFSVSVIPYHGGNFDTSIGDYVRVYMGGVDITSTAFNWSTKLVSIAEVTGPIHIEAYCVAYLVNISCTNCSGAEYSSWVAPGTTLTRILTMNSNYQIIKDINPVHIYMNGVDTGDEFYNYETNTLSITHINGEISATLVAGRSEVYWHIYAPYSIKISNTAANLAYNSSYYNKITLLDEYKLDQEGSFVDMGGSNITASVLDFNTSIISIPRITGDLNIYLRFVKRKTVTVNLNRIPLDSEEVSRIKIRTTKDGQTSAFSRDFVLEKAAVPYLTNSSIEYNGLPQGPDIYDQDSHILYRTGTTSATNPGTYSLSWKLKNNCVWNSNDVNIRNSSVYTTTWSIVNKNITVLHEIPNSITFDNNNSLRIYGFRVYGQGIISAVTSDGVGIINAQLVGNKIYLTAVRAGSGTLTLKVLGSTGYNDSTDIVINYTSTVVPQYNYGDGTLNKVQGGYEGKLLVNGHEQWYNTNSSLVNNTQNFRPALKHHGQQGEDVYPARISYETTDLNECIYSSKTTEDYLNCSFRSDSYGKTYYPYTKYWDSTAMYDPRYDYSYETTPDGTGWNRFNWSIPGNTTINLVLHIGNKRNRILFNINERSYTMSELITNGFVKPLVIFGVPDVYNGQIQNGLDYFDGYVNATQYTKWIEFVFMLNPGYILNGFKIQNEDGTLCSPEFSVSYTDISNARMTLKETV